MEFYADQQMHNLLLKNQYEELLSLRTRHTAGLEAVEEEIERIKENNFFLDDEETTNQQ